MLWQKEMTGDLDILQNLDYPINLGIVRIQDFHGTMAEYNPSIRLDENSCERLRLSYGNCSSYLKNFICSVTNRHSVEKRFELFRMIDTDLVNRKSILEMQAKKCF